MRELARLRWLLILVPVLEVSHAARTDTVQLALVGGTSAAAYTLDALAAAGLVAAGLALAPRPRLGPVGVLLAVAGLGLPLAIMPGNLSGSSVVFTATLVLPALGIVCMAAALVCWSSGAVPRAIVRATCAALGLGVLIQGLASASVYDPRDTGCNTCAANLVGVASHPALSLDLARWGGALIALGCFAALMVALLIGRQMSYAGRRLNGPLLLSLTVSVAAAGSNAGYVSSLSLAVPDSVQGNLWHVECVSLICVALAVAWRLRTIRSMTLRFAAEVVETDGEPEGVLAMLCEAADNATVVVAAVRADGSVVDAEGRPVRVDTNSILVTRRQDVVAEIRFVDDHEAMLDRLHAAVPALALGIERLAARARLRTELADLTASRLRLVNQMDLERRKLERDLHDGAQQRLLALLVAMQRGARRGSPKDRNAFAQASEELSLMLAETRAIARGIHQVVLTDAGLVQGLQALADQSSVALEINADHLETSSPLGDAAVYRLIADLVAACESSRVPTLAVNLSSVGASLDVQVRAAPIAVELEHAQDRIESLGGYLRVVAGNELRVSALIPTM